MTFRLFLIFSVFLFLIACSSHQPKVYAGPLFHENPKIDANIKMEFKDTTDPAWVKIKYQLDTYFVARVKAGFNGSVLVGSKGKIMYERYYGYARKESAVPLNKNAATQLASTSKTFTATAILYLYQKNYLQLYDSVQKFIPKFPYKGITVHDLLCHRSGLPDYTHWALSYVKNNNLNINNDSILALMAKYKPALGFQPNTHFRYSNTNYAVLASIIEVVSKMNYRDFMKKYFFDPLGMKNTFVYDPRKGLNTNATNSYKFNWTIDPFMFADGVYGDKEIYSTVEDMFLWDQSFHRHTFLTEKTQKLAYQPNSFEKEGIKNYGLGWRMMNFPDGGQIIFHNGWWHGANTCFYRFIKNDCTIIVLGNRHNNGIYQFPKMMYNIINGIKEDNTNIKLNEEEE